MTQQLEMGRSVQATLAGAYGAAVGRSRSSPVVVGTEHLLLGLTADHGPVAQAFATVRLTRPVLAAVLRKYAGRSDTWRSDDGATADNRQGPLGTFDRYPARKPMVYTGAARAALHRAVAIAAERGLAEVDNDHLLRGLLAVDDNRAAELLRGCGVEPTQLRDRLVGTGPATVVDDPVAPELRPTRDALLGTASYRYRSVTRCLAVGVLRLLAVNLAELPVVWVDLDARDQARRLGARQAGTEHLVLAILAVHEALRWYPHMQPGDAAHLYAGGRVLAEARISYLDAYDSARRNPERLRSDARPASSYTRRLRVYGRSVGTGQLLLAILTQNDSRGANLLRQLGLSPARVRAQLRATLSGN